MLKIVKDKKNIKNHLTGLKKVGNKATYKAEIKVEAGLYTYIFTGNNKMETRYFIA